MARILAVDDSKAMRDLVSSVLISAGHEVQVASDGDEALEVARTERFDLVLSDVHMPNMNGISLVSKLRRLPGFEYIPMIMVTTEDSDYKKKKAKAMGATGWLVKPFSPERLINAVTKLVG